MKYGHSESNLSQTRATNITSGMPTTQKLSTQTTQNPCFIEVLQDLARLQLLDDWNLASQFVGEVFEEDHVVLRLLRFRCLDWYCRGDAFTVCQPLIQSWYPSIREATDWAPPRQGRKKVALRLPEESIS
jgi:hypothetical protein